MVAIRPAASFDRSGNLTTMNRTKEAAITAFVISAILNIINLYYIDKINSNLVVSTIIFVIIIGFSFDKFEAIAGNTIYKLNLKVFMFNFIGMMIPWTIKAILDGLKDKEIEIVVMWGFLLAIELAVIISGIIGVEEED